MTSLRLLLAVCAALCLPVAPLFAAPVDGSVIDTDTRNPVVGAILTAENKTALSGSNGHFTIDTSADTLAARAVGYRGTVVKINPHRQGSLQIELIPFRPKAVYLSVYGIGSDTLRNAALELIEQTEINALVVDVKGDRGLIPYHSSVALANEDGARDVTTVRDMPALVASLKQKGIYLIARIVVFKDDPLATFDETLAVKDSAGKLWHDLEHLAWTDPFQARVWSYNIEIAEEAARLGFDEIQFDYTRFPDAPGLTFSEPNNRANRVGAISAFLALARQRLVPYNVFLSADIFGYVCWNVDDTGIGQQLEELGSSLDYIAPMLYPSGFRFGIPGYRDPVSHSYAIVFESLQEAKRRSGLPGRRFRPWLQAFPDYAFDRRQFGPAEIREQTNASEQADTDGWMLWNPRNQYSPAGLGNPDVRGEK